MAPERGVIRIWTLAGLLLCADTELRPVHASALSNSCTTEGLGAENQVTRVVDSAQCWNLLNAWQMAVSLSASVTSEEMETRRSREREAAMNGGRGSNSIQDM